jgi:hypothetical protein
MIYQVRRYDPLQLVNHGFAITLLVNLRGRGMALRTPQSQQNIIQARDRFTGVGVSGVELVVQCVDVLRDPKGTFAEDSDARSEEPVPAGNQRDYLQTLALLDSATRTMATIEGHSQRIQSKALELTRCARADWLKANQYISFLEARIAASEARAADLAEQLNQAEMCATASRASLDHLHRTLFTAYSALRDGGLAEMPNLP